MWTLLFDDALPSALFEVLARQVTEHPQLQTLSQHSFWFPIDARPRLSVEHAIVALRRLVPATDGLAGAEWWVPAMLPTQGMEWHCDCDRVIYSREKRFVRPGIGSVFYLGAVGGPTLVVDDVAVDHRARRPRTEAGGVAFAPRPNRYGIFPGDRFHAVAIAAGDRLRITVAINWWTHKPSAPLCIDAPYDSDALAPLMASGELRFPVESDVHAASPAQVSAEELATLPHRKFCPIYPGQG